MQKPQPKATGGMPSTSLPTEACTPVPITACASAGSGGLPETMKISVHPKPRMATVTRVATSVVRDSLGVIGPGCRVVGVTKGLFSLLDLIEEVLQQVGACQVTVSTWTPGIAEMERVLQLIRGGMVTDFRLLVDRSFVGRHPQYAVRITDMFGAEAIRQTRTHMKVALVRNDTMRIAIRTSMNFNTNPRLEQYDLDDDAAIYDLFDGVITELAEMVPPGLYASRSAINTGFERVLANTEDGLRSVGDWFARNRWTPKDWE